MSLHTSEPAENYAAQVQATGTSSDAVTKSIL